LHRTHAGGVVSAVSLLSKPVLFGILRSFASAEKSVTFVARWVVSKHPLGNFPHNPASIVNVNIGGKGHFKRLNGSTLQASFHTTESPSRVLTLQQRLLTTASVSLNNWSTTYYFLQPSASAA